MDNNNGETEVIEVDLEDSFTRDSVKSKRENTKENEANIPKESITRIIQSDVPNNDVNASIILQKKVRIFLLFILGLSIITGVSSIVIYMTKEKDEKFLIYFLELNDGIYIPFRTTSNSLFVILTMLAFSFITSIMMIVKGKYELIHSYLKDTHPYISITLISILSSFLMADFTKERTLVTILLNLILAVIGLLSISFVIYKVNSRRFDEKLCIINECFLSSILCSLVFYSLLFNLVGMIIISETDTEISKIKYVFNIGCNIIYFLSALLFLTLYKDVVYPSCVVILETGMMSNDTYKFEEILTSLIVVVLTFFTVVWTVFKYRYNVFRLSNQTTMG